MNSHLPSLPTTWYAETAGGASFYFIFKFSKLFKDTILFIPYCHPCCAPKRYGLKTFYMKKIDLIHFTHIRTTSRHINLKLTKNLCSPVESHVKVCREYPWLQLKVFPFLTLFFPYLHWSFGNTQRNWKQRKHIESISYFLPSCNSKVAFVSKNMIYKSSYCHHVIPNVRLCKISSCPTGTLAGRKP